MRNQFIHSLYDEGFSPSIINNLQFWFDGKDTTEQTFGVDSLDKIVLATNDKSSNGLLLEPDTTGTYNTDYYYSTGDSGYFHTLADVRVKNDKTSFSFLYDGTAFTVYYLIKPTASSYASGTIMMECGGNPGWQCRIDASYQPSFRSRGSGGTYATSIGSSGQMVQDVYSVIKIVHDGAGNYEQFLDGVSVGTDTNTDWAVGVAAEDIHLNFPNMEVKHILMYNVELSAGDMLSVENWLTNQKNNVIALTDINYYLGTGQSNAMGSALDSEVDASLLGNIDGALIANLSDGGTITNRGYYDVVNIDSETGDSQFATEHGWWLKFAKDMAANGELAIGIRARNGTTIETDWAVPAGVDYVRLEDFIDEFAFDVLKYVHKRTAKVRGWNILIGETDSQDAAPENADYYQAGLEAKIQGGINTLDAKGIDISKLRITIVRTDNRYPSFDATSNAAVRTAQDYIGSNFMTDFPTEAAKITSIRTISSDALDLNGDDLHYSAEGSFDLGEENAVYYGQYINE